MYGPPVHLLFDDGPQFTSKVFEKVCQILRVSNVFTATYHPQCNGQVEWFNRTFVSAIGYYLCDNQDDWEQFTDAFSYAYSATVSPMTCVKPFELVVSQPTVTLSVQARSTLSPIRRNLSRFKERYRQWLKSACLHAVSETSEGILTLDLRDPCPR